MIGICSKPQPQLFFSLHLRAAQTHAKIALLLRWFSPDGQREAVMFQRDCGATTGYSTQISVLDHGETQVGGGNAFRADDNHGVAAVGEWQGPWADMR